VTSSSWNVDFGNGQSVCFVTDGKLVSIHCLTYNSILFETRITDSLEITNNGRKRKLNGQSQIIYCRDDSRLDLFDVWKAGSSLNWLREGWDAAASHALTLCKESLKDEFSHDLFQFKIILDVIIYMDDWKTTLSAMALSKVHRDWSFFRENCGWFHSMHSRVQWVHWNMVASRAHDRS
jgi:hypothetical protein